MSKPYVLTVDDDPEVLGTLERALRREGYEVGSATSGAEALRMLAERTPDLIILDIMMPPGIDGLEVCRRIRAHEQYNTLPILFLTAKTQTMDVVAGLDAGGDDYITKPFELAELTARVRALIRRNLRHACWKVRCWSSAHFAWIPTRTKSAWEICPPFNSPQPNIGSCAI